MVTGFTGGSGFCAFFCLYQVHDFCSGFLCFFCCLFSLHQQGKRFYILRCFIRFIRQYQHEFLLFIRRL